jgi:hypothetical protein
MDNKPMTKQNAFVVGFIVYSLFRNGFSAAQIRLERSTQPGHLTVEKRLRCTGIELSKR